MRNKCVWEKKGHIKLTFTTLVEGVAFWQQLLVWGYSAVPRGQIHFIRAAPTSSSLQRQGKHLSHSPRRTCLGVLDFFVSTCISDSLLRARACFICCWIILKFSHCMIYPNSGRTRLLFQNHKWEKSARRKISTPKYKTGNFRCSNSQK